eukprot:193460_1
MSSLHLLDTIIQTISNNDTSRSNIPYPTSTDLSMDRLSLFIQNKQLLDQFDDDQLQFVQYHIINHVFGGLRPLLNMLLAKLTITTHHKLYIELSHVKENINIQNSTNNSNTQSLSVINILPKNVMSYTMSYLTSKERCYTQQVCRLFAIATRQELSVNCISEQLPLMGLIPYQKSIIKYFSSDVATDNLAAINLCLKYRSRFPLVGPKSLLQKLFQFKEKFYEQIESVMIENNSRESIKLFSCEYRNLSNYYCNSKNKINCQVKMHRLTQKMYGKWRKLHLRYLQSENQIEMFDIFMKIIVGNKKGDELYDKYSLLNDSHKWLEEYLCDNVDIVLYTCWVQQKLNDCHSDYELDKMCQEKIIPEYIKAIVAKENGYCRLVQRLSRADLKKVHKLIKEVNYTEARALNNAFLSRDKT